MKELSFKVKHSAATILSALVGFPNGPNHCSLMYHSIVESGTASGLYEIQKSKFIQHLHIIKYSKREVVDFGSSNCGLSITFDDGHLDNFTLVAEILSQYQFPYTIFMISDFMDEKHNLYMNKEHLREISKMKGVTIGSHGKTHNPLAMMPLADAKEELRISKMSLEDAIGKEVATMSFPHGSFSAELLDVARELGYKKCGTSVPRSNNADNILKINRQCIYSCDTEVSFRQKINGQWDWIWNR